MTHRNRIGKGADIQRFGQPRKHTKRHTPAPKFISIFLSALLTLTMVPTAALANPAITAADTNASAASIAASGNQANNANAEGEDPYGAQASTNNTSANESASGVIADSVTGDNPNADAQDVEASSVDDLPAVGAPVTTAAASSLELKVDYPEQIKCNTPVTFTLTPINGSGPIDSRLDWVNGNGVEYKDHARYEYNMNTADLWQVNPETGYSGYSYDVDCTRFKYQEENTFTYTFAVPGRYRFRFYVQDYGNTTLQMARSEIVIEVNDPTAPTLDTVVENLESDCNAQGYTTEYDKALYVHDRIIKDATYDNSLLYAGASGVLVRGTGTCESFHRAFGMVLRKLGIECYRATGNGHVWSCVKLDGEWTQIDVTWDAGNHPGNLAYQDHFFFGLTDDMMELVHSEHTPAASRPCTTYERNYFIRSGDITKWSDPVKTQIESNIKAGKASFNIGAAYDAYPNVYHIIYPLVAYTLNKNRVIVDKMMATVEFIPVVASTNPSDYQDSYFKVIASSNCTHSFTGWQKNGSNLLVDVQQTRRCTACGEIQTSTLRAQMPQYASYAVAFDPEYYAAIYPDIKNAFGANEEAMFWHFVNHGMAEGRQGSAAFEVASYYNANPDLRRGYGTDLRALYSHYISYGSREGRTATGVPALRGFASSYAGTDWSPVYDGQYYYDRYADLRSGYLVSAGSLRLFDDTGLLAHFVNHGMAEGRSGNDAFDVASYYNANPDLRRSYGTNLRGLYSHYLNYGRFEGRIAKDVSEPRGFASSYAGVEYSSVYDGQYYYSKYPDLCYAYSVRLPFIVLFDDQALLGHFVNHGMAEGRQGSAAFNVQSYRDRYPDLRMGYGSNLKAYYLHYLNHGRFEGRRAA